MTKIVGTLSPRSRSVEDTSCCLKAGMSGLTFHGRPRVPPGDFGEFTCCHQELKEALCWVKLTMKNPLEADGSSEALPSPPLIVTPDKKLEQTDKKTMENPIEADGSSEALPSSPPIINPDKKPEQEDKPKRTIISRQGIGTSECPISLLANHFKVTINRTDEIFYQYSVSISAEDKKEIESRRIGRKVIDKLWQTYKSELAGKRYAYDGEKALYHCQIIT